MLGHRITHIGNDRHGVSRSSGVEIVGAAQSGSAYVASNAHAVQDAAEQSIDAIADGPQSSIDEFLHQQRGTRARWRCHDAFPANPLTFDNPYLGTFGAIVWFAHDIIAEPLKVGSLVFPECYP